MANTPLFLFNTVMLQADVTSRTLQKDSPLFSIFKYGQQNFPLYIKKCIPFCSQSDDALIDIPKLIEHLGFVIERVAMNDKAIIRHQADEVQAYLYLNEELDEVESNAISVLIVSEYLLRYEKNKTKTIVFDVFYLDDIKQARMSKHIFLATRLAIPEKVIEELDEFNSDKANYSAKAKLPMYFLDLAKKQSSVQAYLKMTEGTAADWLCDW